MKKGFFVGGKKKETITFFNGAWEMISLIGEGSYGKVYKVRRLNTKLEDICAIKNIKIPSNQAEIQNLKSEGLSQSEIRDELLEVVNRCLDEIKLMQSLKESSNIVTIEDYEVIESKNKIEWNINIRMELLESIDDYYENNQITNKDILKLGMDISSALSDCKKLKIIHRDIKPDNIFISKFGSYKLGDFGIARNLERTTSGLSKKGTYNYMAPEVYMGKAYNSNVDIYSLGIVLYRYFNYNRIPFLPLYPDKIKYDDRENSIIKRMKGEEILPPINAIDEESKIVLKAISYDPKKRYQNPDDMRADIQKVYDSIPKRNLPSLKKGALDELQKEDISKEDKTEEIKGIKSIKNDDDVSIFDKTEELIGVKSMENATKPINYDKTESIYSHNSINNHNDTTVDYDKTESIYSSSLKNNKQEDIQEDSNDKTESIYSSNSKEKNNINNKLDSSINDIDKPILQTNKSKKRKRKVILLIFIFLLLVFSFGIYKYNTRDNVDYVKVPNFVGETSTKAVKELKKLDLTEEIKYEEVDSEKDYGKVLKQNIKNKKVKEKSKIKLVVGVSKKKVPVPNLVGKTKEEAEKELNELGLKLIIEEQESETVEKNYIISQMTESGKKVNIGESIEVLVSTGKKDSDKKEEENTKKEEDKKTENVPSKEQNNQTPQNNNSSTNQNQNSNQNQNTTPEITGSIQITRSIEYLEAGQSFQFSARITSSTPNLRAIWSSSNPSVASVNTTTGLVTAGYNTDTITLTATIENTNIKTQTRVKVYKPKTPGYLGKYDADGDGVVTPKDADFILGVYNRDEQLDEATKKRADIDGNGVVDSIDAAMIWDYLR